MAVNNQANQWKPPIKLVTLGALGQAQNSHPNTPGATGSSESPRPFPEEEVSFFAYMCLVLRLDPPKWILVFDFGCSLKTTKQGIPLNKHTHTHALA